MSEASLPRGLAELLRSAEPSSKRIPPLENWHPDFSGDMDLRILRDGRWLHEGAEIARKSLVDLFATILWREGEVYFLKTPVEKYRIEVEDVPFQVVSLTVLGEADAPALQFTTRTGDVVVADRDHPIHVVVDPATGMPSPYLRIRFGMDGLISRSVYLELAALSREEVRDGVRCWMVESAGVSFELGRE